jgi:hypothetical protein
MALLASAGYTFEEVNDPSLQRILSSDDEEPIFLDRLLKDFRSMSQMVSRDADVGPNGLPHESIRVVPRFSHQQRFHGWPDTVNDRSEVPRLALRRTPKFLKGSPNSPTLGVAQDHNESCAESLRSELDAPDLRRGNDVPSDTDNKQVTQALIEDDLRWHPRIGTAQNDGKRLLACRQFATTRLASECVTTTNVSHESVVPLAQAFECFLRRDHRRIILVRLTTIRPPDTPVCIPV